MQWLTCTLYVYMHVRTYMSHLGQLTFSLKRRKSEPSQVVVLCCLALFIVFQLFNHVHVHVRTLKLSVHVHVHVYSIHSVKQPPHYYSYLLRSLVI